MPENSKELNSISPILINASSGLLQLRAEIIIVVRIIAIIEVLEIMFNIFSSQYFLLVRHSFLPSLCVIILYSLFCIFYLSSLTFKVVFGLCTFLFKATPHKDYAQIAQSDFSADCTN